ncbi:MAG: S-layer homology domain-containing protein [Eubacteriales bacterium]
MEMKQKKVVTDYMIRKIAGFGCAVGLLIISTFPAFALNEKIQFTDVAEDHFAKASIDFCNPNIMQGKGNGRFEPQGQLTRAEAVQILYKIDGGFFKENPAVFSDVKPGEWYCDALNYAVAHKFCAGYPSGEFKPNEVLTYEQFATMVCNKMKYAYPQWAKVTDLFNANPKCLKYSTWAKDGIVLAEFMQVMPQAEKVDATEPITRAQAAIFANKAATTQFRVADSFD